MSRKSPIQWTEATWNPVVGCTHVSAGCDHCYAATLHIANDAPLEVAEAAYRALVKAAHPDKGGNHAQMVALNAAIEQIRRRQQ